MTQAGPPGWRRGTIEHRLAESKPLPSTYSKADRTVDAVISRGSPVPRFYGTEVLRIDPASVIIDRMVSGGIPLLDSHQQIGIGNALGKVTRVWFPGGGALMGKLAFNATAEGRKAEGMVARGEIAGISASYRVEEWEITDAENRVIDPDNVRWDDDLVFTAVKWELLEASLVTVGADSGAAIRSFGGDDRRDRDEIAGVRARMWSRQRMHERAQAMRDELQ